MGIYEGVTIVVNSVSAMAVVGEMDDEPAWRIVCDCLCIAVIAFACGLLTFGEKVRKEDVGAGDEEDLLLSKSDDDDALSQVSTESGESLFSRLVLTPVRRFFSESESE